MNPFIALVLGAVMGGVLASGGEPKKEASAKSSTIAGAETLDGKTE